MKKIYPNEYALIDNKFVYFYKGEKHREGGFDYINQTGLVNNFNLALIRLKKIGIDVSKPMNEQIVNNLLIENLPNFYIAMGIYDHIIESTILQTEKQDITKKDVKETIKKVEFSRTQKGMSFAQLEELKLLNNFSKITCRKQNKEYDSIYQANKKRPIVFSAINDYIYEKLKDSYTENLLAK